MNRVRQPFNVNNLALAGAIAALDDHEFIAESYDSTGAAWNRSSRAQAPRPRAHSLARQLRHLQGGRRRRR
jgi:histidinol-phosphate/aromatic aminotransferase/cobyric acid decarboxylase-like protein